MNYKVLILEEAQLEFKESLDWYKNINPILSNRFTTSFKKCIFLIRRNPYQFQIRYENVRVILLEKFPYLIHFSVEIETIQIKSLFHTSRDTTKYPK